VKQGRERGKGRRTRIRLLLNHLEGVFSALRRVDAEAHCRESARSAYSTERGGKEDELFIKRRDMMLLLSPLSSTMRM
jgi:hypothetical protein